MILPAETKHSVLDQEKASPDRQTYLANDVNEVMCQGGLYMHLASSINAQLQHQVTRNILRALSSI